MPKEMVLKPIGVVHAGEQGFAVEVFPEYRPALRELGDFSHVHILWWGDQTDTEESRKSLTCNPPYAKEHTTGIFATRSPNRPNPILMTVCLVLDINIERGMIIVPYLDAFDGTQVVDIKAYFPLSDRVRSVSYPKWLSHWPEWMPEKEGEVDFEALGLA
jgi:tRNA-Thr(GGU) m(6)t(6)A37 methyltransferase TsaA